jgi:hypothetical protein
MAQFLGTRCKVQNLAGLTPQIHVEPFFMQRSGWQNSKVSPGKERLSGQ